MAGGLGVGVEVERFGLVDPVDALAGEEVRSVGMAAHHDRG